MDTGEIVDRRGGGDDDLFQALGLHIGDNPAESGFVHGDHSFPAIIMRLAPGCKPRNPKNHPSRPPDPLFHRALPVV